MFQQQTLADYPVSSRELNVNGHSTGGYFSAALLENFCAESLAATMVYSRKDFYKISLVTSHATLYYRDKNYLLEPGDCALVFTNREAPYRWEIHSGTSSGYNCVFTEDFLPLHTHLRPADLPVFNAEGQPFFRLDEQQKEMFSSLFQKMIKEQASDYVHKYDLLFLYLLECIHAALKLEPEIKARNHSASNRIAEAFKTMLAGQFPLVTISQRLGLHTPQGFADKLAVHTNYLNHALKEATGKTTTQLIAERLMQEARALLLHSNWSVSQISHSLGFDGPSHFTKAFRRHTGQTPSSLRHNV